MSAIKLGSIWVYLDHFIPNEVDLGERVQTSLGNANHAISVVGYWIFDSSYGKSLALNRESLDITCAPYFGKK